MLLTVKDLELSNTFASKSPRQAIAGMMGKGKKANVGRTWAFLRRIKTNQALICRAFFFSFFFPFLTSPKHSLLFECFLLSTFVFLLSLSDLSKTWLAAAKVSPPSRLWVCGCLTLKLSSNAPSEFGGRRHSKGGKKNGLWLAEVPNV